MNIALIQNYGNTHTNNKSSNKLPFKQLRPSDKFMMYYERDKMPSKTLDYIKNIDTKAMSRTVLDVLTDYWKNSFNRAFNKVIQNAGINSTFFDETIEKIKSGFHEAIEAKANQKFKAMGEDFDFVFDCMYNFDVYDRKFLEIHYWVEDLCDIRVGKPVQSGMNEVLYKSLEDKTVDVFNNPNPGYISINDANGSNPLIYRLRHFIDEKLLEFEDDELPYMIECNKNMSKE